MCLLLDLERVASGRGAVPRVEAFERARAERGELVDLLLLACALFLWSRWARFEVAGAWRESKVDRRVGRDAGARDGTCAGPTSRGAREASTVGHSSTS